MIISKRETCREGSVTTATWFLIRGSRRPETSEVNVPCLQTSIHSFHLDSEPTQHPSQTNNNLIKTSMLFDPAIDVSALSTAELDAMIQSLQGGGGGAQPAMAALPFALFAKEQPALFSQMGSFFDNS